MRDLLNWNGKLSYQKLMYPIWWNLFACPLAKDVVEFANLEVGTAEISINFQVLLAISETSLRKHRSFFGLGMFHIVFLKEVAHSLTVKARVSR